MKNSLWKFIDEKGTFASETADSINTLYLPLCNHSPFMSSITPDLHGDIKTNFNSFLLEPVSRPGLSNLKSSRNFWIYINPEKIWSATGVSKDLGLQRLDKFKIEAGLLWQKIIRENQKVGLKVQITSFVPATEEPVEIMQVEITNISRKTIKFTPTAAIPIYGRSANNLHDHRHVTSLLNRIRLTKFGVVMNPTLFFDEKGHHKNLTSYFVLGVDENSAQPEYLYPTYESFCGDNSDLEAPRVVYKNLLPDKSLITQGKEAIGALRFKGKILRPKQSFTYIILLGIAREKKKITASFQGFNTPRKVKKAFKLTQEFWQEESAKISLYTGDADFDHWFRWVSIQPELRRIFGCSFLPDFDYGKGGRGWRDLWQDCLSLILTRAQEARNLLVNNFSGVRIDGSNATIIGTKPGEFLADRNNISRVWMDHGTWPFLTTLLYIHQAGDWKILQEQTTYFRDHQLWRGRKRDENWTPQDGRLLKTKDNRIYQGTILEHILIQHLVQFFHLGPHNLIRLENADWNDGMDLAALYGESTAFSCLYAGNLQEIASLLEKSGVREITILEELNILLDTCGRHALNYENIQAKVRLLEKYFQATQYKVSGRRISLPTAKIIQDLRTKARWMSRHIQKNEWLKEGFFNGYYNNDKQRVEGKIKGKIRMTLTGQTFPIMSGIASPQQIKKIFQNACRCLKGKNFPGFRLNTDFGQEQLNLGRAFSFVYGDKENGAFFNHMNVMFAYALYKRNFVREGFQVIDSIYRMSIDTEKSKIYPGLPEYFNAQGRGLYCYLTGSASWFVLTLLTQMFGIKGEYGNLLIEPKLTARQFFNKNKISLSTFFAMRPLLVTFINPERKEFGRYGITQVTFNNQVIFAQGKLKCFLLKRQQFLNLSRPTSNLIEIILD